MDFQLSRNLVKLHLNEIYVRMIRFGFLDFTSSRCSSPNTVTRSMIYKRRFSIKQIKSLSRLCEIDLRIYLKFYAISPERRWLFYELECLLCSGKSQTFAYNAQSALLFKWLWEMGNSECDSSVSIISRSPINFYDCKYHHHLLLCAVAVRQTCDGHIFVPLVVEIPFRHFSAHQNIAICCRIRGREMENGKCPATVID